MDTKQGQVSVQLTYLVTEIGNLKDSIKTLGERLKPVLGNSKIEKDFEKGETMPTLVPLASELHSCRGSIIEAKSMLVELFNTLEI
jgi:hypothetical protein